jgi:DNA polymerase-3 subunit epsilon
MKLPWSSREPLAPVAQAYLDAARPDVPRKTPVDTLRFVVLDAETTGFAPDKDRLLSLAAVPVQRSRLEIGELRAWVIYQPAAPMTEAVSVHGILPAETAAGEPEARVLAELLPLLHDAVLVGHHLGFDLAMLNAALQRHYRIRLKSPALDTAELAQRTLEAFRKTGYPGQRAPSLDEICTHCGIAPLERHTAPGDAFTTAELLLVLLARLARLRERPLVAGDLPLARS